jgi:hypothetical protein
MYLQGRGTSQHETSFKQNTASYKFLVLFLDPECRGSMFLRNLCLLSTDYIGVIFQKTEKCSELLMVQICL